jgi:hypothetical protein
VRVALADDLFEPPAQDARLISLFNYALENRHRVEANLQVPAVAAWLASQSRGVREDVHMAVDSSLELEAREPAVTRVIVGKFAANNVHTDPLQIGIQDATLFLERPLSLLLEDAIADRAFLMAMLTPEERRSLNRQTERGYVHVEHGGGLGSMRAQVEARTADPLGRHRLWVLFDSDALRPSQPSGQSEALRGACGDIPHYQLARRHIESYLPGPALNAWAYVGTGRAAKRRRGRIVDAFFRLASVQRHHFNMKGGFSGDAARADASAGDLFDDVADESRDLLSNGFGSQVGDLFQTGHVTEQGLRRDSGWSELRPVVERLISLTR